MGSRDVVAAWVDALTESGFAVARSGGKRPGPLVSMATALPQGATSEGELIDVFLDENANPAEVLCGVAKHLPPGIDAVSVCEVGVGAPSLQSQLRWAEYEVEVPANGRTREEVLAAIIALLAADELPTERRREKKTRRYDLRPLVLDARLEEATGDSFRLRLRLRAEPERTARADQTLLAMGLPEPTRVHRARLFLEETPAALLAFRAAPQREGD
jgi:radical SAM-linked protein